MNKYELMLIIDPDLTPDLRERVLGEVRKNIASKKVNEISLGKKDLAYPILSVGQMASGRKRQTRGDYMVFEFESDPSDVKGLPSKLNLIEGLVRFMVTKR